MKIAICDDMQHDRKQILDKLDIIQINNLISMQITTFCSGEQLIENLNTNVYDVIILDILMDGIDGIETATKIRANRIDSIIIFISSYDVRVKELFKFNVISFIDKPVNLNELEKAIIQADELVKEKCIKYFSYLKGGKSHFVNINDIIKVASHRNTIEIQTVTSSDEFYGTLTDIWEELKRHDLFIMPQKSYIFNITYINISKREIELKPNGKKYVIGRTYKEDTINRYKLYIKRGRKL